MEPQAVEALLKEHLADCEVKVESEGNHYNVLVIGKVFEGLSAVKKQQLVYGALNGPISEGTIHAVHMKTFTPEEWQAQQG